MILTFKNLYTPVQTSMDCKHTCLLLILEKDLILAEIRNSNNCLQNASSSIGFIQVSVLHKKNMNHCSRVKNFIINLNFL